MEKIQNAFVQYYIDHTDVIEPTIPAWIHESYSQCYEDIIIYSELLAYQLRNKINLNSDNLTYIEIGANHPFCTNSTFLLSKKFGINGILVEPNPEMVKTLKENRPNDKIVEAAVIDSDIEEIDFFTCEENEVSSVDEKFVGLWSGVTKSYPGVKEKITVKTTRVNNLLSEVKDKKLVILFIDVEGLDYQILQDIDFDLYKPYMIIVEPSEAYSPGNTERMIQSMSKNNYRLYSANFVNLIFINMNND